MNFYEVPQPVEGSRQLKQGDILFPVPFLAFSLTGTVVVTADGKDELINLTEKTFAPDEAQLLVDVTTFYGIVLNQSCDLTDRPGKGKPILVARVLPWEEKIKGLKNVEPSDWRKVVPEIKNLANPGKVPTLFYLPEYKSSNFSMPKSVVDILDVVCFPPSNITALTTLFKLRLTTSALQAFQERLAYCFGRFGVPDDLYFNEQEWEREKPKNN